MAALSTIALVAGATAATAGAIGSAKAQRKAGQLQQQQADLQARRQRRQAIRQAQVQRSRSLAQAQSVGGMTGSGAAGGIGSISSQLGAGLGYASQQGALGSGIAAAGQQANNWAAFGNIGGSIMNLGIQAGGLNGVLGGGQQPNQAPIPNYFPQP